MAVRLMKTGENVNLSRTDPNLMNITAGLSWDVRDTDDEEFDLDISILMVNGDGKARNDDDLIFYHNKKSRCGAIHTAGDDRKGGKKSSDNETLHVFLNKVPQEIQKLIIIVSIDEAVKRQQHFGQVLNAYVRLVNKDTHEEIRRYNLTEDGTEETAIIFGEIYRYSGDWKFKAGGVGFRGGLAEFVRSHGLQAD